MSAEQERHARRAGRHPGLKPWKHSDAEVERLRRGVGPEEVEAVQAVAPTAEGAAELAEMTGHEILELPRCVDKCRAWMPMLHRGCRSIMPLSSRVCSAWKRSARLVRRLVRERAAVAPALPREEEQHRGFPYQFQRPRPVVTYMWRPTLKYVLLREMSMLTHVHAVLTASPLRPPRRRSVLNPHDILAYILLRYNVTVRVTTLQEPLLEVAQLLASTDVLLGMHGAAWTNALLVKRGAAAMQLLPYGYTMQPEGKAIRGTNLGSIVAANDCLYVEWTNARRKNAFLRRRDVWSASKKQGCGTVPPPPAAAAVRSARRASARGGLKPCCACCAGPTSPTRSTPTRSGPCPWTPTPATSGSTKTRETREGAAA